MALFARSGIHRKVKGMKYKPSVPLTEMDIGDFNSMDLEKMSVNDLRALEYRLEDLRYEMECNEPADRGSVEYRFWDRRLCKVEDFLDSVQDLLEKLGDTGNVPLYTAFRSLPVTGS